MDATLNLRVSLPKIPAVNGLRGLAILLVVAHHLFIPYFMLPSPSAHIFLHGGGVAVAIRNAAMGVDIFFVLSGFVLYLPFQSGTRRFSTTADIVAFYKHRATRLLPLYFIVVLIGLVLHAQSPIGSVRWSAEAVGLATGLFVFSPHGFMPPSNIVLWSVGVEIWFSLLFPFFVIIIARWGIWQVCVATTLVCIAFTAWGLSIPVARVGQFLPFTHGVLGKTYEFLFGMLACHLFVNPLRLLPRDSKWHGVCAVLSIFGCGLVVAAYDGTSNHWFRAGLMPLFVFMFSLFLLSLLLGAKRWRKPFELWVPQLLGCMCYSIYAWHGILLNVMVPPESEMETTLTLLPLFLAITLALSALSYRYIEFGSRQDWRALFLLRPARRQQDQSNSRTIAS